MSHLEFFYQYHIGFTKYFNLIKLFLIVYICYILIKIIIDCSQLEAFICSFLSCDK